MDDTEKLQKIKDEIKKWTPEHIEESFRRRKAKSGVMVTSNEPMLLGTVALATFHLDVELFTVEIGYTSREFQENVVRISMKGVTIFPEVPEGVMYPIWTVEQLLDALR